MMRNDPEHQIQCAFIEWCRYNEKRFPALKLGFAVPNGGGRSKAQAGRLKAEGVRPGVPDWMLPVSTSIHVGLALEFKSPTGRTSKAQHDFIALLRSAGWMVDVCRSVDTAIEVTTNYLARLTPDQGGVIVPAHSMPHRVMGTDA